MPQQKPPTQARDVNRDCTTTERLNKVEIIRNHSESMIG